METAYLGLGSNLGERRGALRAALVALSRWGRVVRASRVYETEPVGVAAQPPFLNMAVEVRVPFGPAGVLRRLKALEAAAGRRTGGLRYGPRVLDIDLLLYGTLVVATPTLTLPHPDIARRAFVLLPLAEIAPTRRLVPGGPTVAELAAAADRSGVVPFEFGADLWRPVGPRGRVPAPGARRARRAAA